MSSTRNDILFGNSSYSKDNDASDISSRILFSFGMGLCIAILCCTVFMFCSRRVDLFITSRLTRNHVFVVHYMDERCSSHISELETWTDTDCDAREDADTIVPFNIEDKVSFNRIVPLNSCFYLMKMCDIFQNKDDTWVEAMMNDLVRVHSPSMIDTSCIHQIADFSNRLQHVECTQLESTKSNGGSKVICINNPNKQDCSNYNCDNEVLNGKYCSIAEKGMRRDNSVSPQMRLANRFPIPIDSESNHLQ